jgi:hypothetical protein
MTPEKTDSSKRLSSVKDACDKAPAGPKKDRALRHYQAAEKAHQASDYSETNKELDAATKAIS